MTELPLQVQLCLESAHLEYTDDQIAAMAWRDLDCRHHVTIGGDAWIVFDDSTSGEIVLGHYGNYSMTRSDGDAP